MTGSVDGPKAGWPLVRDEVRAYPWPYQAALSISNDCDFFTLEAMLGLHQLFATTAEQGGLGIEYSDSFFFYQNGAVHPTYSYFEGLSQKPSRAAPAMREMLRAGYLDATHAMGDFENGAFRRSQAEHARDEMARYGLKVPIWSNHGGFGNIQNIGRVDFFYHQSGDDLSRPFYVLDVAQDIGVRYYWLDAFLARRIDVSPWTISLPGEEQRAAPISLAVDRPLEIIRGFTPKWTFDRDSIFDTIETRAGSKLPVFARYDPFLAGNDAGVAPAETTLPSGRRAGPNIGRIALSLTDTLLRKLVDSNGCAILYQHFSTLAHLPERRHMTGAIEFHPANLEALRRLGKLEQAGKVWVPALAHFLDYLSMINTTEVDVKLQSGQVAEITVTPRSGHALGEIAGLTVRIPREAARAAFVLPGGSRRAAEIVGPDAQGDMFATLAVRRLPKVDWPLLAKEAGVELPETPCVTLLDGTAPVDLWYPGSNPAP